MKCPVKTLDNKASGEIELNDSIFGVDVRKDLLARAVNWQLAKRRAGTQKVKGRSEISGAVKKIYRQKGTGRARHSSSKAPIFRGGGVAHGPQPRSHAHDLPRRLRKLALKCALSAKAKDGKLFVVDSAAVKTPKTKDLAGKLDKLGWSSALLIEGEAFDANFALAARNIQGFDLLLQEGANVYDILRRDTLVLTKNAVEALEARLK